MNALTTANTGPVDRVPASLSDRLIWLTRFGQPRLSYMDKGFHARIDMHVSALGASFQIGSDFDISTPDAAVAQLIERMLNTLANVQKVAG